VNLGFGAYALGLGTEAEHHVLRGLGIARARREMGVVAVAEALLAEIGKDPAKSVASTPKLPPSYRTLARNLATRLRTWRGSKKKSCEKREIT
jgi:hypothetical protein